MRKACRVSLFVALLSASACAAAADRIFGQSFENPVDCSALPNDPECLAFTIATPAFTVAPGEEGSTCYYFHAPNTTTVGIDRIASWLAAPVSRIVVFATFAQTGGAPADRQPPGTLSSSGCSVTDATNNTVGRSIYHAHATSQSLDMPTNDGSGKPVAIEWQAGQPLVIQMVALNPTSEPLQASATLRVDALPTGTAYTRTEMLSTYNSQINIPPNSFGDVETTACNTPAGVSFWHFTTQTHKQGIEAKLEATAPAAQTLVLGTDWENPAITEIRSAPYFTFASGSQLRTTCTYNNPTNRTIVTGDSEATDEVCIGLAYFFPATQGRFCFNNLGPF